MLFVSRFSFNFYSVNNNNLCFIIYRIEDAVVTGTNAIAFFFSELLTPMGSWNGCERKNSTVNRRSKFLRNIIRLLTSFFFDYYLINQFLSQVLRNLSYGIKEVASLSALRRSFESSRSSINSRILLYSLKLRTIPFLLPFSSVRYVGFADFAMLCIFHPLLLFENICLKDSIRGICEAMETPL